MGTTIARTDSVTEIMEAPERYSEIITPWATKVAENFTDIVRKNDEQWRKHSKTISRELRNLVSKCPPVAGDEIHRCRTG